MYPQLNDMYLRLLCFIHQTRQQALRMVNHFRRRLREGGCRIVAKSQDTGVGDSLWQEVFLPERDGRGMGSGVDGVAAETMHRDDAVIVRDR